LAQRTADNPTKRPLIVDFYLSTVGMKWVMALTGVMLFGFVLFHMIGNIKIYLPDVEGVPDLDVYAAWLRNLLVPFVPETVTLWIMRGGLIAATGLHLHATVALTRRNLHARGDRSNSKPDLQASTYAARTMRLTGPLVLAFIIFHLLDITFGSANPDFIQHHVYHNVVVSLQRTGIAVFYILAQLALGYHLYHGLWSMFQSLGINSPKYNKLRRTFATSFTLLVVGLNISFVVAVMTGLVKE
jgi:succinate dehydrogenase / fumarate reductase cytochrome b subunit